MRIYLFADSLHLAQGVCSLPNPSTCCLYNSVTPSHSCVLKQRLQSCAILQEPVQ